MSFLLPFPFLTCILKTPLTKFVFLMTKALSCSGEFIKRATPSYGVIPVSLVVISLLILQETSLS